jgi:predicted aspartyl protease
VDQFTAFTVKGNGLLPELKTAASVRPAQSVFASLDGKFPSANVQALWDTGATASAISPRLATQLGLKPIGRTTVCAAGNKYESDVYFIDVLLPNKVMVQDVRVTRAETIEGFDLLVGMDIILLGDMAITNAGKQTVFSFRYPPGAHHVDYVQQVNQVNTQQQQHDFRNRVGKIKRKKH